MTERSELEELRRLEELEARGAPTERGINPALGATRSALEGMTLNFSDEIGSGIAAGAAKLSGDPKPYTDIYRDMQDAYRRQQEGFEAEHPYLSMGSEVAGALATGGMGAGKTAALQGGKRVGALVGGAAALGAAAGAGQARPEEVLEEAIRGGVIGAGLGAAIPGVTYFAGKAIKKLIARQRLSAADRKILQAIIDDDMTPDSVKVALGKLGKNATIADAGGENLVNLMRTARGVPGKAANQAEEFFQQRMRGEFSRIVKAFRTGLNKKGDFFKTVRGLEESRKQAAKPLYEQAYRAHIDITPELDQIMARPNVQKALKKALTKARNEGVTLDAKVIDTKRLDYTKRALDDMIAKAKPGSDAQRVLVKTKNDILRIVDEQNPVYKEARQIWSDSRQLQDALESGAKFLRGESDLIADDIARMTDAEKEFFRLGAIRSIKNFMGRTKDTNSLAAKFDNPAMRERLQALFPDDDSFKEIMRVLAAEERFGEVRNKILRGSQTLEKQNMAADFGAVPGVATELAAGNPHNALLSAMRGAANTFTRPSPRLASRVLSRGTNNDMAQNIAYLEALKRGNATIDPRYRQLMDAITGTAAIVAP